ncbi:hypothetical protein I6N95_13365 [Vagococcus sp. BWB3-3]|uniref:Uncharacterized protein n=1 Tax=Vagococcus allomyrinae TaxID=2794353 RepID=A0A940P5K7_9ENTE|nr:hypothetical protein [Vagococcus allomyrinae]MBP1042004.1 hypothetical protein [Vagococcus allomyrinae]
MNEQNQVEDLLDKMLENISRWDQTAEDGMVVIQNNQKLMAPYQGQLETGLFDNKSNKLALLIQSTKEIQQCLKSKRQVVLNEINQITKTDKIIDGYLIQHKESVFIDRDF